jgi:hypothetical protein
MPTGDHARVFDPKRRRAPAQPGFCLIVTGGLILRTQSTTSRSVHHIVSLSDMRIPY